MYGHYGNDGGFSRPQRSFAPVKVGDEVDVRIEAVGEKGDGIAKVKGFVIFVPGVKEGDEVRIKITRVLKKVGFGESIGDAEGPIEEDSAPEKEPAEQEVSMPAEQSEEPKEDSESFGEEPAEEKSDSESFGEEPEQQPEEESSEEPKAEEKEESSEDKESEEKKEE